jgi:hypothetical protein
MVQAEKKELIFKRMMKMKDEDDVMMLMKMEDEG